MKKILITLVAFATLVACGNNPKSSANKLTKAETVDVIEKEDVVEILYFHGKKRCITCQAIEDLTKEVVEESFADAINNKKLVFKIVDFSTPDGEKIANEYEIAWSAILINKWEGGKETVNDLTKFGFAKAKNFPEEYKEGIRTEIAKILI